METIPHIDFILCQFNVYRKLQTQKGSATISSQISAEESLKGLSEDIGGNLVEFLHFCLVYLVCLVCLVYLVNLGKWFIRAEIASRFSINGLKNIGGRIKDKGKRSKAEGERPKVKGERSNKPRGLEGSPAGRDWSTSGLSDLFGLFISAL
jgi:hypothetical protein